MDDLDDDTQNEDGTFQAHYVGHGRSPVDRNRDDPSVNFGNVNGPVNVNGKLNIGEINYFETGRHYDVQPSQKHKGDICREKINDLQAFQQTNFNWSGKISHGSYNNYWIHCWI